MPFYGSGSVERISPGDQLTSRVGVSEPLCHVKHFGVKVTDPLQLVVGIPMQRLDHKFRFVDHIGVYPLALKFRYHPKYDAGKALVGARAFEVKEF